MKSILIFSFIIISLNLFSQEHDHSHYKNHLGIGGGATTLISEDLTEPGFHLHYMRKFNSHSLFSAGVGYEIITGEHLHHTVSTLVGYSPIDRITVKAGPGLTFTNEEEHSETSLSGHVEFIYEFELGGLHLGPMIGYGIDKEESHVSFGVHVGLGF